MNTSLLDKEIQDVTYDEYYVSFYDHNIITTVTADPYKVAEWVSQIESIHRRRLHHLIVGIDIKWRPSYSKRNNPAATLQLSLGHHCLIFQLLHCSEKDIPRKLWDFLNNPKYTFVGVGVKRDAEKLNLNYGHTVSANLVDLGVVAAIEYGNRGLMNADLKGLARVVLGKEVEKPRWVKMSSWDQRYLSHDQVQYACVDAFLSFQIGLALNASGIIDFITGLLRLRHREGSGLFAHHLRLKLVFWIKPTRPMVKLNADGSWSKGIGAGGGLIRDYKGEMVFAFPEHFGCCSVIKAELLALRRGFLLCKERGLTSVWMESDAEEVVWRISKKIRDSCSLDNILDEIFEILHGFDYQISHIHREGNKAADALAKEGRRSARLNTWEDQDVPNFLCDFLRRDKLEMPNFRSS